MTKTGKSRFFAALRMTALGHLRLFPVTALVCAMLPAAAAAQGRAECRTVPSTTLKRSVRYCALLPPSYDTDKTRRFPVLYYLHGLGDNEQSLMNFGGWDLIEQLREQKKIGEFIIVTPDGGRSFYVNSKDGREPYEDFFIKEFIPAIERRYRSVGTRAGRGVGGFSMGGYGALRFAFKYPQMFVSVSAHSAALFEDLPESFTAVFNRNLRAFGEPLDAAYWKENTPFAIARARALSSLGMLRIYFDCGRSDDYGFDAGAEQLHKLLEQKKVPHEFHIYPGSHSGQYVADHLDESLAFHSRALGAK